MKRGLAILLIAGALVNGAAAQVPTFLNYQGRVVVNNTNFDGTGQFKFAFVDPPGTTVFWSNDGTAGEPADGVSLPVVRGLFSLQVGNTNLAHMVPVPYSVFTNESVFLRVWFNDGVTGFQRLEPDQPIAAVAYAMIGATVPDGSLGIEKLSAEARASLATGTPVYIESDPIFTASAAYQVTAQQVTEWNEAFGWGDHAAAGYLRITNNLADVDDAAAARDHLGLADMATQWSTNVEITGGSLVNVTLHTVSNALRVGEDQLVAISNGVGIGTAAPGSRLHVAGSGYPGEYVIRISSGSNAVAWGRRK